MSIDSIFLTCLYMGMTSAPLSTAPGTIRRDTTRPPIATRSATYPGAVESGAGLRRTVQPRVLVTPLQWLPGQPLDYAAAHIYVRTFWTALLGPSAVADYLRLVRAAERHGTLKRPRSLNRLARAQLVRQTDRGLEVRMTTPPLSAAQVLRLAPAVRRDHAAWRFDNPR